MVSRRNLPHWKQDGVIYFVTFRLADSLPVQKLDEWRRERNEWLTRNPPPHNDQQSRDLEAIWDDRINDWLDAGHGACHLRDPRTQTIVADALRFFDGERYELDHFVVMPNHVHALVMPIAGHEPSTILHSWKSFTANQINKLLARSGQFWQDESFDHIVRDDRALMKFRKYIAENPAKLPAGSALIGTGKYLRE